MKIQDITKSYTPAQAVILILGSCDNDYALASLIIGLILSQARDESVTYWVKAKDIFLDVTDCDKDDDNYISYMRDTLNKSLPLVIAEQAIEGCVLGEA